MTSYPASTTKQNNFKIPPCRCTKGRKYAHAYKSVANLIGGRVSLNTRYGKLCCEPSGTTSAYHVVYVNISNSNAALKWAQTGYGRERNAGGTNIVSYRYAEMNASLYKVNYDKLHVPSEGSSHTYQCELDRATGTWTFSYDGTSWQTFTDTYWKTAMGTSIQWTGEIYNKEDDMPGTAANKCHFTNCQYRTDGHAYADANLSAGDVHTDDSGEWGVEWISGTAFNIWDIHPRP